MYRVPTETGVDLYPHENGVVGGTDVWSGNDEGGPRGRLRPHPINRRDVTTKVEPTFERLGSRNRVHCVSGVRTLSVRLLTGSNRGTSGLRSTHSVLTSTLVLPSSRSEESFHHRSNHKRISWDALLEDLSRQTTSFLYISTKKNPVTYENTPILRVPTTSVELWYSLIRTSVFDCVTPTTLSFYQIIQEVSLYISLFISLYILLCILLWTECVNISGCSRF